MKIEKKHIIIAIVVAVVAYLLWKRSRSVAPDGYSAGTVASPKTTVDGVLAAAGANSDLKRYARNIERSIEKDPKWKQSIMDKAADNGYTYAQQVVLEAIWLKYTDNEGHYKEDTPWDVLAAVKDL